MRGHRPLHLLLFTWLGALGGCAHMHVDAEGRQHVVGLVWVTLPPAAVQPIGAEALRLRSLGLSVTHSAAGSGATLGYADFTVTVIRNDAQVNLPDPNAPEGARP